MEIAKERGRERERERARERGRERERGGEGRLTDNERRWGDRHGRERKPTLVTTVGDMVSQ